MSLLLCRYYALIAAADYVSSDTTATSSRHITRTRRIVSLRALMLRAMPLRCCYCYMRSAICAMMPYADAAVYSYFVAAYADIRRHTWRMPVTPYNSVAAILRFDSVITMPYATPLLPRHSHYSYAATLTRYCCLIRIIPIILLLIDAAMLFTR